MLDSLKWCQLYASSLPSLSLFVIKCHEMEMNYSFPLSEFVQCYQSSSGRSTEYPWSGEIYIITGTDNKAHPSHCILLSDGYQTKIAESPPKSFRRFHWNWWFIINLFILISNVIFNKHMYYGFSTLNGNRLQTRLNVSPVQHCNRWYLCISNSEMEKNSSQSQY